MKTRISSFVIILLLFQTCVLYSQNQNDVTKIIPGKKYKIVLFDDSQVIGVVISIDSVNIIVKTENKTMLIIPRNNVLYYSTNLTPAKYNFSVGLLGGISVFTGNNILNGNSTKIKPGVNFNIAGIFFLSDSKAIKLDAGYTFLKPTYDGYYYASYPDRPPVYEGGDISQFSFKGNIMVGNFDPSDRFMMYASLGFGFHYMKQKEHTFTYWYRNYQDSTWINYTEYYPAQNLYNAVISIGASLGYRFTKNFGVSGEIEYNLITANGLFLLFGSGGYFPIRAGLFYIF
jgi:hypothetical protein